MLLCCSFFCYRLKHKLESGARSRQAAAIPRPPLTDESVALNFSANQKASECVVVGTSGPCAHPEQFHSPCEPSLAPPPARWAWLSPVRRSSHGHHRWPAQGYLPGALAPQSSAALFAILGDVHGLPTAGSGPSCK